MKAIKVMKEYPTLSPASELVGVMIKFWIDQVGQLIIHHQERGFVDHSTQECPWVNRISKAKIPTSTVWTALLTPEKEIRVLAVENTSSTLIPTKLSWDDMAYLAVEANFDVCSRELCP